VGPCVLQSDSHSRLMPVPKVSCLDSQKRSPAESSEEPVCGTSRGLRVRFCGSLVAGCFPFPGGSFCQESAPRWVQSRAVSSISLN
jgi:hypothetical protein